MWVIYLVTIATLIMTLRAFLMVLGAYKDPILSTFEAYGPDEPVFSPFYSLVAWALITLYIVMFLYFNMGLIFGIGLFVLIPIVAFRFEMERLLKRYQSIFCSFPRWYLELIQSTDREERRRIAFLWLRLPLRTRMLYNTNSHYFHLWVDQVLLTIA